uniref:Protein kinase domain-containing protein n=1 Tax=Leersia perrieri TaxID=77586 RepID=A0A0D9XHA5_9ORYZ
MDMASFWLLAGVLLQAAASAAESVTGRASAAGGCQAKCGEVEIPYPFGIGPGCFRSAGFEIACSNTTTSDGGRLVPTLAATSKDIKVKSLVVDPRPEAKVMLPVAYQCYNSSGNVTGSFDGDVQLNDKGVYRISDTRNKFVILGCNTVAWTQNGNSQGRGLYSSLYYTGCVTYCRDSESARDGKCAGVGCCHVDIPPELTDNVVAFQTWPRGAQVDFSPCDYGFLVARDEYRFLRADLNMERNRTMPVWLDWAIRDTDNNASSVSSCPAPDLKKTMLQSGYACVSVNSECVNSTNGPGYYCKCSDGYEGNPYIDDPNKGCKDIDECVRPRDKYPCYGVCRNTEGDYDCSCRAGYQPSGGGPKKQECSPKFPVAARLALGFMASIRRIASHGRGRCNPPVSVIRGRAATWSRRPCRTVGVVIVLAPLCKRGQELTRRAATEDAVHAAALDCPVLVSAGTRATLRVSVWQRQSRRTGQARLTQTTGPRGARSQRAGCTGRVGDVWCDRVRAGRRTTLGSARDGVYTREEHGRQSATAAAHRENRASAVRSGISLGFSFLIVAILFTTMMLQKRKMNEYFRKNGGSVLQKVDNIIIFSKDDLNKILKNDSEVLGQGGFGKVYKGRLKDNTLVAVKTSTEVDVPILVYEFAANGNLKDILHGDANRRVALTLDLRLDIAIESAEGLRYMHSSISHTIRHGDIKPANILLTDKFIAKISDFGTSKLLTADKEFTKIVAGSMGYIDPVFYMTGHLTQKSDVYSFGVVLLELISRKTTVYDKNCSLIIEFQKAYKQANSGMALFDKDIIAIEEDILILEEIGRLALDCLKENIEERPDMKEVTARLMMLRRSRNLTHENYNVSTQRNFEEISFEEVHKSFGDDLSTSSSATLLTQFSSTQEVWNP